VSDFLKIHGEFGARGTPEDHTSPWRQWEGYDAYDIIKVVAVAPTTLWVAPTPSTMTSGGLDCIADLTK
jgi:hypothetical protein